MKTLSHQKLLEYLSYDCETGIFYWRKTRAFTARKGAVAGSVGPVGYRVIRIENQRFFAHRLAWFYVYQKWPYPQIDHINRIKDDNRIENLREATPGENQINNGPRQNNTSGLKGVRKFWKRWRATIGIDGKIKHLGTFDTKEEAYGAYCKAAQRFFGEFAL